MLKGQEMTVDPYPKELLDKWNVQLNEALKINLSQRLDNELMTRTRSDLLNYLANKYQLKRYLEIGLQRAEQNFDKIQCEYKVSVDPDLNAKATFQMTSDEFFEINTPIDRVDVTSVGDTQRQYHEFDKRFDLIFIDGMHEAEQVRKDFEHAIKYLSPNGWICIHDCNPQKEEHTIVPRPTPTGHWNGSVYKFAALLSINKNFCTVDIDNGVGVFRGTGYKISAKEDWSWYEFEINRKKLLNLISWEEFLAL